ncbi:MAG: MMPL family transporter [Streptomycetales bacterium]
MPSISKPPAGDSESDTQRSDRTRRRVRPGQGLGLAYLVLLAWAVVTAVAAPLAGKVGEIENNDTAFLPRGAESTQVQGTLTRLRSAEPFDAVVVYVRESGLRQRDRAAAEHDRRALAHLAEGQRVDPPRPAQDGAALLLTVAMQPREDGQLDRVEELREEVAAGAPAGLDVKVTGAAGALYDEVKVFSGLDRKVLLLTAGVVTALLLLTYRSPVLWMLPLLSVGVATQVANGAVYLLGKHAGLPVDGQSGGLLTVLVFGVGTDYALLLIARYREELHRHERRRRAMAMALRQAGPAILASAATVALGLLCLLAADMNSSRSLGGVGAVGIVAGFAAMITLLPALLVVAGRWIFWPYVPRFGTPVRQGRGPWVRVGRRLAHRPRRVWVGSALALAAVPSAVMGLSTGLTQEQSFTGTPDSVAGQRNLARHYPAGAGEPTVLVADREAQQAVLAAARTTPGVAAVPDPVAPAGSRLVRAAVVLGHAPDSDAAKDTVLRLRDRVHAVPEANALIGGPTAAMVDTEQASERDQRVVMPMVLAVVLLVLVMLLRSLAAPLLLIATVVLSYGAALGAGALVLAAAFDISAVDASTPLIGFVFLVALGVDYNIFLMTRVREEVSRRGHHAGVLRGLAATGGVITSAGLVLAATFSVFAALPLVFMVGIGVVVALGVLLDTFVVRSLLVPALALDLGPRLWWPRHLGEQRALPLSGAGQGPE